MIRDYIIQEKRKTGRDYIKRDEEKLYKKRWGETTKRKIRKDYKKSDKEIQGEITQGKTGENKKR